MSLIHHVVAKPVLEDFVCDVTCIIDYAKMDKCDGNFLPFFGVLRMQNYG